MKKLLASIITMLLLVSAVFIAAFPTSAADVNYDDFEIFDGVLVEYLGSDSEVTVPSVDRDGNPVTKIDSRAFRYNESVTSVVISEGIESIGSEAFEYCKNLVEVSLPYSLKEADYSVFRETSLMSIVIPGQLKTVPPSFVIGKCSDVVISPGVEEISNESLYGNYSEIIFPESVVIIEASVFPYFHTDCSFYFCNPDVILGRPASDEFGDAYGPIVWERQNSSSDLRFYSLKGSNVEEFAKEYQSGKVAHKDGHTYSHEVTFIAVTQDKLDQMQAQCKERGITSAPETSDKGNTGSEQTGSNGGTTGSENNNQNNNIGGTGSNNNNTAGNDNTLTIVIIIAVVVVVLILAVTAVIIVLMLNKNNKKKKKKKVKPAAPEVNEAPTEQPVTEETPAEEAPIEEEKGEEE